ncbi:MAG: 3,5-cyclic-AMP phosphodiesterase, partial [Acidimicrobiaceae bacterium]|nr:3,5-cyclic-AMP phosphodiesterase [Acidimicrobiaceae bacterium]
MCRELTRRELLRFSGLVAATPLIIRYNRPVRAFAQVASRAVPINLELVTLTDSQAILTWFTGDPTTLDSYGRPAPIPADTVVQLGTHPAALHTVVERDDQTPYHYVELGGLEPGQTYFYLCLSNGRVATPTQVAATATSTGQFTVPMPPPGKHLFTMAWANDAHIGESTSGLAASSPVPGTPGGGFPPGFPVDPNNPYWQVMALAAVAESRQRGAELLLVAGDLTSEAAPADMARAKSYLDGFGAYRSDYFVVRGNHDRPHKGAAYDGCRPAAGSDARDCLLDTFFPDGRTFFSFDRAGVHFVGLDTNDVNGMGAITAEQFDWLQADLTAHHGTPTFLFGHHPVSEESAATALPPIVFTVNQQDAQRLEGIVA